MGGHEIHMAVIVVSGSLLKMRIQTIWYFIMLGVEYMKGHIRELSLEKLVL